MNLITGTTGLVGSHLTLRLLEKGEKVRGIFRSEVSKSKTENLFKLYGKESLFPQIEWIQADILDIPVFEKAFVDVERVYHCAAFISFDPKDEEKMRKVNIEGTANVVNCCIDFGIKKLCHVSSVAALGDLKEGEKILTEETEWNPEKHHSDYGISKYGAEMEVWRGWQEGLETVSVVPGIIIGPGFWNDGSGAIFSTIEKGFPFYTTGSTGFVAVKDVVSAMISLMESDISGERFILIGEHLVLRDMAYKIADALSVKRPKINAGRWLTTFAVFADWLASLFGKKRKLFAETSDAFHRHRKFSNDKIRTALGFEFTPIHEYIRETVRIQKGKK
ncbi:NAD-dependent epimerase/dehydratase family protein [Flavobacterium sp. MAH-1]|uniref:NAD-dependent epimerase/dehydratase family protein n=1 Tax=Flavobacterium agri TaxID=2743471 RepID=A0A7Y8Y1F1_9FLAO|nr:NAD-dependent epimerase/dehydratase family protein [Flavobacterium agri]NUY80603.1 NAD-dependent epimerase/dehydratase family protein [Flavobacterium agri]NYA70627.1 NAD-dependent epimerase/dehydratase family protein [Flavobacterium agri]